MKRFFSMLFVMTLLLSAYSVAYASDKYQLSFNTRYGTVGTVLDTCKVCHTVTPALNSYGTAFKNNARNYATIEPLDSDGEGFTNLVEINARTFPGDAASKPAATDIVLPKITAFSMPLTSTSLTVPITKFTATDNVKATGYLVKATSTKPLATSTLWRATAPKSRTFAAAGTKTLYAWVKDAAGNISLRRSRTVTITLPLAAASASSTTTAVKQPVVSSVKLIPVPTGQQVFTYDPADSPIRTTDPAHARPVGAGSLVSGGDNLNIRISIGPFTSPVDIFVTAYAPSGEGFQPMDVFTLKPDNNFEPLSEASEGSKELAPWKSNVTDVDESIVDNIPVAHLPSGLHLLLLTVVSSENPDSYYQWVTYFIVP